LTNPFGTRESDIHRGSFATAASDVLICRLDVASTGLVGELFCAFFSLSVPVEFEGDDNFRLPMQNQDRFASAEFFVVVTSAVSDGVESTSFTSAAAILILLLFEGLELAAVLRLAENHQQTKTTSSRSITIVMPIYRLGPNLGK